MPFRQRKLVEKLFLQYMKDVFGICFYFLKEREASEDVVMETFEVALNNPDLAAVREPKMWLLGVARNLCYKKIRKEKKHLITNNLQLLEDYFMEFDLDTELLSKERILDRLLEEIASLDFYQSKCVELFYLQKQSYQSIADELNIELKKVKSHIQNGKRNLKIRLEKDLNINEGKS